MTFCCGLNRILCCGPLDLKVRRLRKVFEIDGKVFEGDNGRQKSFLKRPGHVSPIWKTEGAVERAE